VDIDAAEALDRHPLQPTTKAGPNLPSTTDQCLPEGEICVPEGPGAECCDPLECRPHPFNYVFQCMHKDGTPPPFDRNPLQPTTKAGPTLPSATDQCIPEGQSCKNGVPPEEYCCEPWECRPEGTEPNPGAYRCVNTTGFCAFEEQNCAYGPGTDCCGHLVCRPNPGLFQCVRKSKPTMRPWPVVPTWAPMKTTLSPGLPVAEPKKCLKADEPCAPHTPHEGESQEGAQTPSCCPNHLCDLDHNKCRRVAYRGLQVDSDFAKKESGYRVNLPVVPKTFDKRN